MSRGGRGGGARGGRRPGGQPNVPWDNGEFDPDGRPSDLFPVSHFASNSTIVVDYTFCDPASGRDPDANVLFESLEIRCPKRRAAD
jgi:hypothetical protein